MASPVIIRPVWRPGTSQWVAGFLFLPCQDALRVKAYLSGEKALPDGRPVRVPNDQIVGSKVAACEPLKGLPNAIEALKQFVRDAFKQGNGFEELKG
jgi:hypothetical protein